MPRLVGQDDSADQDVNDDRLEPGVVAPGGANSFLPVVRDRPPSLCDFGCANYHEVRMLVDQMAPIDGSDADARYETIRTCYPATGIEFPLEQVVTECNRFKTPGPLLDGVATLKSKGDFKEAFGIWMKSAADKDAELQKEMEDLLDVDAEVSSSFVYRMTVFAPDGLGTIGTVDTTMDPNPDLVRELVPSVDIHVGHSVSVQVRDASNDKFVSAFSFIV